MSKSLTEAELRQAVEFVGRNVEPRVKRMVDEVNKLLAKQGILAGLELQWIFNRVPEKKG